MTAYRARLTEVDIHRLIKATDDDERAAAAHKLCRSMDHADLTDDDRAAAQKILRMIAEDAAEQVVDLRLVAQHIGAACGIDHRPVEQARMAFAADLRRCGLEQHLQQLGLEHVRKIDHALDHLDVLGHFQRGGFTGGADRDDGIGALLQVEIHQFAQGLPIQTTLRIHGRDQCHHTARNHATAPAGKIER